MQFYRTRTSRNIPARASSLEVRMKPTKTLVAVVACVLLPSLVGIAVYSQDHLELVAHQSDISKSGITITATIKNGRWGRNEPVVALVFSVLGDEGEELGIASGEAIAVSANTLRTARAYFDSPKAKNYEFREFLTGFEAAQFLRAQERVLQERLKELKRKRDSLIEQLQFELRDATRKRRGR